LNDEKRGMTNYRSGVVRFAGTIIIFRASKNVRFLSGLVSPGKKFTVTFLLYLVVLNEKFISLQSFR